MEAYNLCLASEARSGDPIVDACRAEMDAGGLSIAAAAKEMGRGVSTATLSRWLSGQYDGDVAAVTARVERWLRTREEARRRDLTAAGLDRHVDLGVTEEVAAVLSHAQAAGDVVLIHGRSGSGKTWAVRRYCQTRSAAHHLTVTGAVVTLSGLLTRVADAVGAGNRHPSGLAAETAAVERLQDRRALLCVDEAHHLRPQLLDELRCVRDLSGAGLALIGGDELWTALASSPRCHQIVGRIGVRLPLSAPAKADVLDLAATILGRDPDPGEARGLIEYAHRAGGLHALRRILARAWILARSRRRDRIAAADLTAAAEEIAA
ncbi:MAG: AAA family ATPase [Deltaproteobacteria bacterium]|nr:AAA family ATPase [Deltaproteobacteria bacterium]